MQVDIFSSMSSFQCWRWAGCCWCWQCGRVPEPSCVALCDFNHPPTRQSKDPIAPHMPMPTRTTHRIPSASNFFRRRNWMFLPKEKLSDTSLIRGIIPRVFRCWILLLDTRLMASGLWIVDCGLWIVETKMPGGFTLQEVNWACFLKPEPKSGEG